MTKSKTITSYKGFSRDWTCREFQFEVGKTYTHDGGVKACESGFHACEYPLDVFRYYAPAQSTFGVVEQSGKLARHAEDTKIASERIEVKARIDLAGLTAAAVEYTRSRCEPIAPKSPASSTGDYGAASSTGNRGAASSTGNCGAASSTGYQGAASSTGYRGAASSTGDYGAASSTGYRGAASSTGYRGAASSTGEHSVACGLGHDSRAMAGETGAICLVERDDTGAILHIRASKVGENGIKAGVWYTLKGGQFCEVTP